MRKKEGVLGERKEMKWREGRNYEREKGIKVLREGRSNGKKEGRKVWMKEGSERGREGNRYGGR